MRIVGGKYAGRDLTSPNDFRVRPTAEHVRAALLDLLASDVRDASVLDLFAGTGALGLEALSRGAAAVDFVERAPAALQTLRRNVAELGVDGRCRILRADALRFAEGLAAGAYDLAVADPPYEDDAAGRLIAQFRRVPFARLLAVEHAAHTPLPGDDTRRYGDTALTFCHAP